MESCLKKTITMLIALLSLLVTAIPSNGENFEYTPEIKDDNTEYEVLCTNVSVEINFSGISLNKLSEYFISSPLIECLDLRRCGISELDYNAFNNLPKLKYLQISYNYFKLNNIFSNEFKDLEVLILDNSQECRYYYQIDFGKVFPKLRKLFLRNTVIETPSFIISNDTFPSLTHLYLSGSRVKYDNFDKLPENLEYLDITGHNLQSLTLRNLKNLKVLFMDKPYEKRLNELNLQNLNSLKYLSAPSNQIDKISLYSLTNITSLLYLDLSDNNIKYIEGGALDTMQNLRFLNLSNNQIEIVQGGTFDKLSKLETLVLEKNNIAMFPMIGNEIALKSLVLNCNKIKNIIGGTFVRMPNLESLFLHENEISYVDQQAFAGLVSLKLLTLTNNKLSALPTNWIVPMINLEDLDLAGNRFKNFGSLSLNKSSKLKNLYLSKQILSIRAQALLDVPENVTISFDENFKFVEKCEEDENKRNRYYG